MIERSKPSLKKGKNIGKVCILAEHMNLNTDEKYIINYSIKISNQIVPITCILLNNVHVVIFISNYELDSIDINELASEISANSLFSNDFNLDIVKIENEHTLKCRFWEKDRHKKAVIDNHTGAILVAAFLNGYIKKETKIKLYFSEMVQSAYYSKDSDIIILSKIAPLKNKIYTKKK